MIVMALIIGSCIKEKQTGAELVVGDRIPEFTVTLDSGVSVSGTDLSQGVSCIVFFHTTCPDCRKALPILQEVYEQYCSKDVKFLLISREELAESIELFWTENSLTMPYSAQKDRSVYEKFAKTRIPRLYICKEGIITRIFTDNPVPTYEDIKKELELYI